MIIGPIVPRILTAVEYAEHIVLRDVAEDRIETEPSLTDRFVGALEVAFENEVRVDGYRLSIRTLRDRGPNAAEREFGADLVWILNVDTSQFGVSKGFLVQAKMAGRGEVNVVGPFQSNPEIWVQRSSNDMQHPTSLYSQSRQMLAVTTDSFVFVYAMSGIFVLPASSIVSLSPGGKPRRVFAKRLRWLIQDFANCFIGDLRINAYDDASLRQARNLNLANEGILLSVADETR